MIALSGTLAAPGCARLTLGTVQFGMDYGIANAAGRVSREDVRQILADAHAAGVACLDTAAAYGESEAVLGWALRELRLGDAFRVVTKVPPVPEDCPAAEVDAFVERSVLRSLERLGLERLAVCLFHREETLPHADALLRLRDRGLMEQVGWSVMTPGATAAILDSGQAAAVQVPASLLDRRFADAGLLARARRENVSVFVRSVYLQGLLLMPEASVPEALRAALPARRRLEAVARQAGMRLAELALRYALSLEGAPSVVVGVDSVAQMRENLRLAARGPLPPDVLAAAVDAAGERLPDDVLLPTRWPTQ